MATSISHFREILALCSKYSDDGEDEKYFLTADHDQIWFINLEEDKMSDVENAYMEEYGCFLDDGVWSAMV